MIAEAEAIKAKLAEEATLVKFVEKVGPDGRTFGSITSKKIAEELTSNLASRLINAIFSWITQFVRLVSLMYQLKSIKM